MSDEEPQDWKWWKDEAYKAIARAEAAEKERDNLGDSLRNYAALERIANERAEAAEKRVKTLELAIEDYLENWEDEGIAKRFRAALKEKINPENMKQLEKDHDA